MTRLAALLVRRPALPNRVSRPLFPPARTAYPGVQHSVPVPPARCSDRTALRTSESRPMFRPDRTAYPRVPYCVPAGPHCVPASPVQCSCRTHTLYPRVPHRVPIEHPPCTRESRAVFPSSTHPVPASPALCSAPARTLYPRVPHCVPTGPHSAPATPAPCPRRPAPHTRESRSVSRGQPGGKVGWPLIPAPRTWWPAPGVARQTAGTRAEGEVPKSSS